MTGILILAGVLLTICVMLVTRKDIGYVPFIIDRGKLRSYIGNRAIPLTRKMGLAAKRFKFSAFILLAGDVKSFVGWNCSITHTLFGIQYGFDPDRKIVIGWRPANEYSNRILLYIAQPQRLMQYVGTVNQGDEVYVEMAPTSGHQVNVKITSDASYFKPFEETKQLQGDPNTWVRFKVFPTLRRPAPCPIRIIINCDE